MSIFEQINEKYNLYFYECDIAYEKEIQNILDGNISEYKSVPVLSVYIGIYYYHIEKNYCLAKEYYLTSIENGYFRATSSLGWYYEKIEKDYSLAKTYYLMSIEKGYIYGIYNLALYYIYVKYDYYLGKKYHLIAIEKGCISSMNNLAIYYYAIEEDYDLAKKYFLMAIEHGNISFMNNLALYYEQIEQKYDLAKKYYFMALKYKHINALINIANILHYIILTKDDIDVFIQFAKFSSNNKDKLIIYGHRFNEFLWHDICVGLGIKTSPDMLRENSIYELKIKNGVQGECRICFVDNALLIPINWYLHMLCTDCYKKLYKSPCPYCRL